MWTAEIGPVRAAKGLALRLRRRRCLHHRDGSLGSAAALEFRIMRFPIIEGRERSNTTAVKLKAKPEEQHHPGYAPAGDQRGARYLFPDSGAGPQPQEYKSSRRKHNRRQHY